ncbi:MAG TPA: hypothetical protein DHW22_00350 [Planctomycetaceae bacterium]|nr:hypothetical protein [Planctomycetaceae bacterium]
MRTFSDNRPALWSTNYGFNFGAWFVYNPLTEDGGDGVSFPDSNLSLSSITDGRSKTLMVSEVKAWTACKRNGGPSDTEIPVSVSEVSAVIASQGHSLRTPVILSGLMDAFTTRDLRLPYRRTQRFHL